MEKILFENQVRKRTINQTYIYVMNLLHMVLDLMPGFVRNVVFRLMLKSAGKHIFFDYRIYIKFPWLVEMGDHVSINRGVEFYPDLLTRSKIIIGSNVYIAPNVCFHASGHDINNLKKHIGAPILIGDDVWIGAGSILLPGVTVGSGSIVGAGSVVTKDVPPRTISAGVPSRVVKELDKETM